MNQATSRRRAALLGISLAARLSPLPRTNGKTALCVVAAVATAMQSGCVGGPTNSIPHDPTTAPKWNIGDRWNYVNDGKQWQNWTVIEQETRNGRHAYQVLITSTGQDYSVESMRWIDTRTLGIIEMGWDDERGDANTVMHPPMYQLFPLMNRTYESTMTSVWETTEWSIRITVADVRPITVPAGTFGAILVDSVDTESGTVVFHGWYSPAIRNYAFIGTFDAYKLESWHAR